MTSDTRRCSPANADLFFNVRPAADMAAAVELCLDCPLMIPCRDVGRSEGHMYGVWGAETGEERQNWLAQRHPDPEVREEATRLLVQARRSRESRRQSEPERPLAALAGSSPAKPESSTWRANAATQERAHQRAASAWRLYRNGSTPHEIAEELGASIRTVQRYLARAAEPETTAAA